MLLMLAALSALIPAANAVCPMVTEGYLAHNAQVLNDGTFDADASWLSTPSSVADPFAETYDVQNVELVATTTTTKQWMIGVTGYGGYLVASGLADTAGLPSGEEPYSHPSSGNRGRFAVLNKYGQIRVWGFTSGGFGTPPNPALPSGAFENLDVGADVGCATHGENKEGIECWGTDLDNLVSGAPTWGYWKDVEVGRYYAVAIDYFGNTYSWGTKRPGYQGRVSEFLGNMPTSGVKEISLSQGSDYIGVAWMDEGYAVIWEDNSSPTNGAITGSPGYADYSVGGERVWIPQGPDHIDGWPGYIIWASGPEVNMYSSSTISGVMAETMGLEEGLNIYAPGDAMHWYTPTSYASIDAGCTP